MNMDFARNAISLPERLFPDVNFETNEARYYETLNRIAVAVAEYRYDHHLTQTSLAKSLGVTQAMISKYESGDYNISLKAAFDLLEKLGLRLSCVIEPENETVSNDQLPAPSFPFTGPSSQVVASITDPNSEIFSAA